jgi:hypothetical protein
MHTMQGRTAKLNISLNTSSTANQSNLGVNNNYSNSVELLTDEAEDEEDMDVPENVEEIIEMLLSGLRDMVCLKGEILIMNFVLDISTKLLKSPSQCQ